MEATKNMAKIDAMRPGRRMISPKQFQNGGDRIYGRGPVGMNCVCVDGGPPSKVFTVA